MERFIRHLGERVTGLNKKRSPTDSETAAKAKGYNLMKAAFIDIARQGNLSSSNDCLAQVGNPFFDA